PADWKYAIAALCVPLTYRREHNWSLGHRRLMPSAVGDVRQCLLIENLSLERCRKRKALHVTLGRNLRIAREGESYT
ncbi:MAG: hypothetical protein WA679_14665, partial [Pseudolabrys sp.]